MRPAAKVTTFDPALRRASLAQILHALDGEEAAFATPEARRERLRNLWLDETVSEVATARGHLASAVRRLEQGMGLRP